MTAAPESLPATLTSHSADLTFPAGVILPYAGDATDTPTGWLYCDGSPVSRATYSTLFAVIGTRYGAGDGATTFNLPDCRGRVLVSAAPGGKAAVAAIGNSDGLPENLRNISHHHNYFETVGGNIFGLNSAFQSESAAPTSGDPDNLDAPAFLVIGGQIIKS